MGNLYIKPGSLIKSAGDPNNGYIAEAKNIKYDNSYSIQDKIDELYELINNLSPTPPPTQSYTIMLFVTNGTMSPNDSQTVISGGSAVWTIYPNAGFQLPTSVNGATINENRLTVSNVTSDQTIEVICEPIPVTQTYYWYVGTTKPNAVNDPSTWRTTSNDAGFTINPNISSSDKIWVAYPDSWTLEITDADGYGVGNDYLSASIKNSINGYLINRFTADSNTSAWAFKFIK